VEGRPPPPRFRTVGPVLCDYKGLSCAIKQRWTTGKERRITRGSMSIYWRPYRSASTRTRKPAPASRDGRTSLRYIEDEDGATHFLVKRLPKAATEMALHVLAYNLTRVMNIMGIQTLMAAIRA